MQTQATESNLLGEIFSDDGLLDVAEEGLAA